MKIRLCLECALYIGRWTSQETLYSRSDIWTNTPNNSSSMQHHICRRIDSAFQNDLNPDHAVAPRRILPPLHATHRTHQKRPAADMHLHASTPGTSAYITSSRFVIFESQLWPILSGSMHELHWRTRFDVPSLLGPLRSVGSALTRGNYSEACSVVGSGQHRIQMIWKTSWEMHR